MGRMPTRNTTKGARTREDILRAAADIASVDGLDGLSIGRLAAELGMSKSGLFAHFGSKESLQLATIEEARNRYVKEVIEPALSTPSGITRLYALCEAFLSYIERAVFPGGCFFASAMAEFDAKGPSLARDRIVECQEQWMITLERAAEGARTKGELRGDMRSTAARLRARRGVVVGQLVLPSLPRHHQHRAGPARRSNPAVEGSHTHRPQPDRDLICSARSNPATSRFARRGISEG